MNWQYRPEPTDGYSYDMQEAYEELNRFHDELDRLEIEEMKECSE